MEPVEIKVRPRYWDRTTAIQYAVPGAINTIPAESILYNKEEIFKFIRRSADKVWVVNDGAASLYVRYATEGVESFSDENVIFPKEYKVYYNVFELHLRSPTAGLPYRVSEFEIMPCCIGGGGGGDVVVTNTPLPTDPIDRCARLLGQLCYAGSPIDPRAIRALAFLTDSVDVSGSSVNVSDRCARLLGQLCSGGIAIDPRAIRALAFLTDKVDVSGSSVSITGTPTADISDRCARLLGQLCSGGIAIDPRAIRALAFLTDKVDVSGSSVTTAPGSLVTIEDIYAALKIVIDNLQTPPFVNTVTGAARSFIEGIDSTATLQNVTTVNTVNNVTAVGSVGSVGSVTGMLDVIWNQAVGRLIV